MSNKYCQALAELRSKSAHELKEVGDRGGHQTCFFGALMRCSVP